MKLRAPSAAEADVLASLHATAFDAPWTGGDIAQLMGQRGSFALLVESEDAPAGFILCRVIAGEGEVLTLAVAPEHRRQGLARALVEAALEVAALTAGAMFLEVAADNAGAIGLYRQAGFVAVGRRIGYYTRSKGEGADAVVMRHALNRSGG